MAKPDLKKEWAVFYTKAAMKDIDQFADKGGFDWESLCVGWCMAQGLAVEEAVAFYSAMVAEGKYF